MAIMFAHALAPLMFAALICVLLLGYPVAFSLAALGLGFFAVGVELAPYSAGAIHLDWPLLTTLPERIFSIMTSDALLAIPFFTFLGLILERSGMAEDLLETTGRLFGPVRGGLAYAVIFVGALLAATTGVVAASVISMGLISLPIMLRHGYDRSLSAGVIAASGTLAQIMPPALVLIVLADQMQQSVGDMYRAAFFPASLLALLYAAYVALTTWLRPHSAPAFASSESTKKDRLVLLVLALQGAMIFFVAQKTLLSELAITSEVASIWAGALSVASLCLAAWLDQVLRLNVLPPLTSRVVLVMTPPLALIFIVLGSIIVGIATPSEAGAMGGLGALLLAFAKGRLSLDMLSQALDRTARLTCFAVFILVGARVFSLTFFGIGGHQFVESFLTGLPGGRIGFLIIGH